MSSYEHIREIEPFCVFLLVLFFLGLVFIPKGRVKKVLYNIYCVIVVLVLISVGQDGVALLTFGLCLVLCYGTVYGLYVGKKALPFLYFIGAVLSGLCFLVLGRIIVI